MRRPAAFGALSVLLAGSMFTMPAWALDGGAMVDGGEAEARPTLAQAASLMYEKHHIEARRKATQVRALAEAARDDRTAQNARELIEHLEKTIPRVTFERPPRDITDLLVTFDDRRVPNELLEKKFSVDPGLHHVHAEGTRNGEPLTLEQDVDAEESTTTKIALPLAENPQKFIYTEGNLPRTTGCRACELSTNEPMPLSLLLFPLAAIARRATRRATKK